MAVNMATNFINPVKSWKVLVTKQVRKIASIATKIRIQQKYLPIKENIANLGRTIRWEVNSWHTWAHSAFGRGKHHGSNAKKLVGAMFMIVINGSGEEVLYLQGLSYTVWGTFYSAVTWIGNQRRNTIWSQGHINETSRVLKRLKIAILHAWSKWRKEYMHGLIQFHQIKKVQLSPIGETFFIAGEERNRDKWMKGRVIRCTKGKNKCLSRSGTFAQGNHTHEKTP